ncbi:MAG TPA: hypothetical protein VE988_04785 [Gemmataceae bacterium]|nr:hypothetical protein [Gemmataceae bacterium]
MMDLLYKLLGIDVPAGSTAQELTLQFRGPLPAWLVIVLAIALCGLVAFLYITERGKVGWFMRILMAGFRAAALLLLLALICRPVLHAEFEARRQREVVLLIDNTQSMKQQDRRLGQADKLRVALAQGLLDSGTPFADKGVPTKVPAKTLKDPPRAEMVREVLMNGKLNLLADLQKHGPLVPLLFGHDSRTALGGVAPDAKRVLTAKDVLAKFDSEQSQTALADAVNVLLQRKDGDLPAAIVIMTDGQDNASKYTLQETAQECARLNVPLHIYGAGSDDPGRLKLRDLVVQDTLFAEDSVTIPVRWRASGMEQGGTVLVSVNLAGDQQTKQVPIQSGQDQVTEFTFKLPKATEKVKKGDITATVKLMEDDSFNDEQKRPVQIVDGKVRVLYVEYAPRKEYHFLLSNLDRDRRIDPHFWLITADPKALGAEKPKQPAEEKFLRDFPNKKDLAKYDVVILGDVPIDSLKKVHREALEEFVNKNRGGLVVIAGRQHMPAAYANTTDLAPMLPVEFQPHKFAVDSPGSPLAFQPQLTPAGLRTEWLALAEKPEDNFKQWKDLPGIFWFYPVNKLRPGAVPLMVHPTARMGDEPMPLAATHFYGKGQVVFLGFEESWRWRFNTQDKVFGKYWSQLLLQLSLPHKLAGSASQVEFTVNRSNLVLGKTATLHARLLDSNYEPFKAAEVEGVLEYLDAKPGQDRTMPLKFEQVPGREKDGDYTAFLPNNWPGRWQVRLLVPALRRPGDPEPPSFAFSVALPPLHELEDTPMAAEALRTAASMSGGRFYQEESLHEMAQSIKPRETVYTLRQEVLLWGPLTFLIFTAVVTCEWVLRKFGNLS